MKFLPSFSSVIDVDIKDTDTVQDVRARICEMSGHEPSQIKLGAFGEKFEDGRMMCDYDTGVDLYVMCAFEVLVSVDGKPPFFASGSDRISTFACRAGVSKLFDGERYLVRKKTLYQYGFDVDLRLTSTPISSSSSPSDIEWEDFPVVEEDLSPAEKWEEVTVDTSDEAEPWETDSLKTAHAGSTSSCNRR